MTLQVLCGYPSRIKQSTSNINRLYCKCPYEECPKITEKVTLNHECFIATDTPLKYPQKIEYKGHIFTQQRKQKNDFYYRCWQKGDLYGKYLHQLVWEETNGTVPEGMCVHHINGDKLDNRLENLTLVDHKQHIHEHKVWEN